MNIRNYILTAVSILAITAAVFNPSTVLAFAADDGQDTGPYAGAIKAQYDSSTNTTTTATRWTPRRRGDILVGRTGGTTTVWVATGTNDLQTTNDWFGYTVATPSAGTFVSVTVGELTGQTNGSFAGDLSVSGETFYAVSASDTVTNTALLVCDQRWNGVTAATAVTNLLLAAPTAAGDEVYVVNTGTNAITVPFGGNLSGTNNMTLPTRRSVFALWAQTATNWIPRGLPFTN